METIIERWLPVVGFEGFYEVSNFGRVRAVERIVVGGHGTCNRKAEAKEKKLNVAKTGYPVVNLYKDNKYKQIPVHRLVAEAFIPNPNNYPVVNHLDGNKLNNNVSNLEWCTQQRNVLHAFETGLVKKNAGRKVKNLETGCVYRSEGEAARRTGLSQTAISKYARTGRGGQKWEFID